MKIAVIGTGIAGNVAAFRLAREHDVTVFEAADRIGGHTNTVDVMLDGQQYAVDTGFIVFNNRTYPNFIALLAELGVASQASNMGFSVQNEKTGLQYSGAGLNGLFAQRTNLLRPSWYRMLRDILRFNAEAPAMLAADNNNQSLGQFLDQGNYSRGFIDNYILPMGGAIWSAVPDQMRNMPASFFIRFFANHGLLTLKDRPEWRVIQGGSRSYVEKLIAGHRDRIHLNAPVQSINRCPGYIEIGVHGAEPQKFDQVFIATHSDQALAMLSDATDAERQVLGAITYQRNEAVLHTDDSLMPRHKRAWAAWNYHVTERQSDRVTVTYNMNILQQLDATRQMCVTLNNCGAVAPERILGRYHYSHPLFTPAAVAAQNRHAEINGQHRTYFCGAYWRYGFHEDGVVSALNALKHFEQRIRDEQRNIRRVG